MVKIINYKTYISNLEGTRFVYKPVNERNVLFLEPPSKPISLLVVASNATSSYIQWNTSVEEGERKDLFYRWVL